MARKFQWFRWVMPTTPELVAKALVKGLERESSEILAGWQSQLAVFGNRLLPSLLEMVTKLAAPLPENNEALNTRLRKASTFLSLGYLSYKL